MSSAARSTAGWFYAITVQGGTAHESLGAKNSGLAHFFMVETASHPATDLALKMFEAFPGLVSAPVEFRAEKTIILNDPDRIAEVCQFAKQELGFDFLVDVSSVDNYGDDPRFTIVYELYGLGHRQHLR